jgi:hypothetical protein
MILSKFKKKILKHIINNIEIDKENNNIYVCILKGDAICAFGHKKMRVCPSVLSILNSKIITNS